MPKNSTKKYLTILLCLSIVLSFSASGLSADNEKSREYLYTARLLFNMGNYNKAVALYKQIQDADSTFREATLNLAIIYKNLGQYKKAIKQLKEILKIESNAIIYLNLGEVYYLNSMPNEAIDAFKSALRMGQGGALIYFWIGKCFQDKGDLEQAKASFKKAVEINPAFALGYLCLGKLYVQDKMWDYAEKAFDVVKELDPSITEIYPALGFVCFKQKRYEQALKAYRKVEAVDPDNTEAKKYIARIYKNTAYHLKEKTAEREKKRLEGSVAKKVPTKKVKDAPLVRVHIGDMKKLRLKCAADFFITGQNEKEILFKGEKNQLYSIIRDKEGIVLVLGQKKVKQFNQKIRIFHRQPNATILIFDVEAGKGEYWASKTDRVYRGVIEVEIYKEEFIRLINTINMEEYLYGVLPSEMPSNWPAEALKAQAVAARSEAYVKLSRHEMEGYNFCADVHCQVYSGAGVETEATNSAVDTTTGEVAVYNGKPIDAVYSNSCGGHTQGNIFGDRQGIVYLHEKQDAFRPTGFYFPLSALELEDWLSASNIEVFCNNNAFSRQSNFRWMRLYTQPQLERLINKKKNIGKLIAIRILERNPSSHVHRIQIIGSRGKFIIEKELNIRQIFGNLRSGMFNIAVKLDKKARPEEFLFYGGGWGHGVGMCQVGAATMAQEGFSCEEILKFYYTDIDIEKLY